MLNEEGAESSQSPIPETQTSSLPPVETSPVMPQAPTPERARGLKALLAMIKNAVGGKRESSSASSTQPSMSSETQSTSPTQSEAPQPQSTPGTPTT